MKIPQNLQRTKRKDIKFLRDFSNPFERIEHKTIDETKEILKEFADHFNNMIDSLDDAESLLNELYPDKDIVMWVEFDSDDFYVTFQERKIESDEQFEKSAKEYYNEYLEDIEDERLRKEKELEKAKIQYEMELEAIKNQYENRLKDINSNR